MPFTPHAAVNVTLQELLDGAQAILGDEFVGLYLYGSLASGDFNPATSDLDFLVVTAGVRPAETVRALEALHTRLWAEGAYWAAHLEGAYQPRQALRRRDPRSAPVPQVNEGHFYLAQEGSDWVIQRRVLREHGLVVAGPAPATLIDPVTPDEVRWAVAAVLREWWAQALVDPAFLRRTNYQAYAVLTMCRALVALEHGAILSKPAAARWARDALDPRWRSLIDEAVAARPGVDMGRVDEIVELIRYTLERSRGASEG